MAWPCYYGIDTPTRSELIAQSHTVEEINQYLTSDSLAYLPLDETQNAVLGGSVRRGPSDAKPNGHAPADGTRRSLPLAPAGDDDGHESDRFCHACFSGDYPVVFQELPRSRQMRLLDF